eukprot:TRINITY_DN7098_c0_g1_i1.p1 TRINITY_DN7098_c0_g1~~TRINITY_DN7098_c0_g1_i1.p1  ORF type:complete len:213 (+),score=49.86 TRINITY_DN7098_c0_g1_i1:76-714(+)
MATVVLVRNSALLVAALVVVGAAFVQKSNIDTETAAFGAVDMEANARADAGASLLAKRVLKGIVTGVPGAEGQPAEIVVEKEAKRLPSEARAELLQRVVGKRIAYQRENGHIRVMSASELAHEIELAHEATVRADTGASLLAKRVLKGIFSGVPGAAGQLAEIVVEKEAKHLSSEARADLLQRLAGKRIAYQRENGHVRVMSVSELAREIHK